jgi:hypothetical protein
MRQSLMKTWLPAGLFVLTGGAMVYVIRRYGLDAIDLRFLPIPIQICWFLTVPWVMYFGGGALVGLGVFLPFKKASWGALTGFFFQFVMLVVGWLTSAE